MKNLQVHLPRWEELPNLDLYLDQVVTVMEEYLEFFVTDKEDKIITKTMINNYVKHEVIKSPENKKYSKVHLAKLIVICILKQLYSINEICNLINLSLDGEEIKDSYNKFCEELENAIDVVFDKKEMQKEELTDKEYIMRTVVLSFSNKLYVEKNFLNKENNSKN